MADIGEEFELGEWIIILLLVGLGVYVIYKAITGLGCGVKGLFSGFSLKGLGICTSASPCYAPPTSCQMVTHTANANAAGYNKCGQPVGGYVGGGFGGGGSQPATSSWWDSIVGFFGGKSCSCIAGQCKPCNASSPPSSSAGYPPCNGGNPNISQAASASGGGAGGGAAF